MLLAITIAIQVAIGATAVSTGLPTFLRGAHVAGAAASLGGIVLLFALEVQRGANSAKRDSMHEDRLQIAGVPV